VRIRPALSLFALVGLLAAGCSDDGGEVVEIAASDDACVPAETELAAGKTTFRVRNEGDQVTEVYVYADGDRVVTERENIGPGTSADFSVDLAAGTYELACKPGQTGDGIRQEITVTD
jgi:iron uptake system component EfeO